jgi:hypothetical protein
MKPLLLMTFVWLVTLTGTRGEEVLLTTVGKFVTKDGAVEVDIRAVPSDHIKYSITFWMKIVEKDVGEVLSKRSIEGEIPAATGVWAVAMIAPNEVWMYAGKGSCAQYKNTEEKVAVAASCSEPKIAERAPELLKQWMKIKEPNQTTEPISQRSAGSL